MAQPVFDEHPLQAYFQGVHRVAFNSPADAYSITETGETTEPVPGDFLAEYDGDRVRLPRNSILSRIQIPPPVSQALQTAVSLLSSQKLHRRPRTSFAERFKYDVISSSLLSASLAATPLSGIRPLTPENPELLDTPGQPGEHSRTSSATLVQPDDDQPPGMDSMFGDMDPNDIRRSLAVVSVAILALAAGYEFLAYLLFALALYVARAVKAARDKTDAPNQVYVKTMEALNELISAGNLWDSAVNEAMSIVEKDEQNPSAYYGPTSPNSPLADLRSALQAALYTTQSQCDSVRELMSALTSPAQLSQLSEMYAPPSPVKPSFISLDNPRPLSDPIASWRRRSMPANAQQSPINKRATWNGSYAPLVLGGSPSPPSGLRKREGGRDNRRSQLSSVFMDEGYLSASAPPSPLPKLGLQNVQEEEQSELAYTQDDDVFGVAAMDLRRKRRSGGMETFGVPPPSYTTQPSTSHSLGHSSHYSLSSAASPSRFTLLQTNRHPLSLSALHMALHGALAAKRYSCSHLLALRFEEDAEDEPYWEDVRSVMALLTSTFADASSQLLCALDEAEKKRIKDERPSTESLVGNSRDNSMSPDPKGKSVRMKTMAEMVSFAPMPSHLTRFAAHVDTLSTALNDAREHLELCVAALREEKTSTADAFLIPTDGPLLDASNAAEDATNPALEAYDRFRKELGFALRECERGRERLLDVINTPKPSALSDEEDEETDPAPPLIHDASSEESVSPESFAFVDREAPLDLAATEAERSIPNWDDASQHLLLSATSEHLPPPGVEQVYEAESGGGVPFSRERSKLSREERIRLAKERRASGITSEQDARRRASAEQWGPGGEVVQELKDVIWKVGEQRRKMREKVTTPEVEVPQVHIDVVDHDANAEVQSPIHPGPLASGEEAS
ncbi:hypothetical protein EIP86_006117 [Pleurotus ostreatoroseus]|nr:hypothetical protein EIP86_006117 [Pleurotus ostreatoroseus]